MQKNVSGQKIGCQMVSATDGSAFTSAVTVYVTGDAGAQAAGSVGSGACTHEGNGYHTYAPAQAETNYDLIAFTFIGTGAVPATVQVFTGYPQTGDAYARLGAPAGASVSADVAAVKAQTAAIETDTQDLQTQVGTDGAGLTAIGDTRLANLDATVSSRLATAGYTAPLDASGIRTSVGLATANLDTQLAALPTDADVQTAATAALTAYDPPTKAELDSAVAPLATAAALATVDSNVDAILVDTGTTLPGTLATIAGYVDTEVAAIKAKTDNLPASPAATGDIPTAAAIRSEMDSNSTQLAAIVADTNELQTDWADGGRLDLLLDGASSAGDPWTATLPGAYGAGTAGKIVGDNLDATVSSRSTFAGGAVASVTGNVGGNVAGSVGSVTGAVGSVTTVSDKTGYSLAADQAVNATKIGGTTQTGRDLGASVLISSGTGTGQLDVTSGVIKANLAQILGTALTETSGYIAAAFKQFFNVASPTGTMKAITNVVTTTNLTNLPAAAATAAELAKVPKSDGSASWNATALAAINAQAYTALADYDGPTNAEMVARTLPTASYFDPAADTVAHVTLVDTTTTNADMVAEAPSAATVAAAVEAAILDEGDATALLAAIAAKVEDFLINDGDATATLAAIATAVRSELSTELGRIDVAVSTRNATTPPTVAAIRSEMDSNSTQLAAIVADTGELQTDLTNGGRLDLLIDGIKAKTDNLPASPAAVGSAMTLTAAYDAAKTASSQTSVDDIPTNAELASALAGLNDLDSTEAQAAAAAALTAYDPPTNAEMVARTLLAANYFDPATDTVAHVTLVDTTTTNTDMVATAPSAASIRSEMDSNSTKLAAIVADTNELQTDWADGGRLDLILDNAGAAGTPPTVEEIRIEMDSNSAKLAAIVEDTGTTLPAQIAAIDIPTVTEIDTELTANHGSGSWSSSSGSGARTVLVTVDDGTDPLQNARVRFTEGVNSYVGLTDSGGQATFNLDNATWTVAITKVGYTFSGTTLVVDGDKTPTYSMDAIAVAASDPGQSTGYLYCYDEDGNAEENVVINVQITATPETTGYAFDTVVRTETSDANGLVEVTGMWIGATYQVRRYNGAWHSITVPDAASFALPALLGR